MVRVSHAAAPVLSSLQPAPFTPFGFGFLALQPLFRLQITPASFPQSFW